MRQVDLDELTYQIFSGLRRWTPNVRARIFAPPHKRHHAQYSIAAESVCRSLTVWEFLDPLNLEAPLTLKRVSQRFEAEIAKFPGAIAQLWLSRQHDREREAHAASATLLARSLDELEVLSPTSILHLSVQRVNFPRIEAPDYAFAAHWP